MQKFEYLKIIGSILLFSLLGLILVINLDNRKKIKTLGKFSMSTQPIVNCVKPQDLRPYYYLGDNTGLTMVDSGLFLYVDTRDRSLAPHLIASGVWEENNTKVFKTFLRNRKNIIDLGANFGYFTLIAANELRKNKLEGKVFSIEALPRLSQLLRQSILQNGFFWSVEIINNIIGDKETELDYVQFQNAFGGSSVSQDDILEYYRSNESIYKNYQFEVIKLQAKTLDQVIPQGTSIDILRMDIQGYEFLALKGAKRVLAESSNIIIFMEFDQPLVNKFSDISLEVDNLLNENFKFWLVTERGTLKPITKTELLTITSTKDIVVSKIDVLKEYPELQE